MTIDKFVLPARSKSQSEEEWLLTAPLSQVFSDRTGIEEHRRYGDEHCFPCPFHHDTVPSLFINDVKAVGFCFGCGIRFNRFQLFKLLGIEINNHSDRFHYESDGLSQTVRRELEALNQLGRGKEAMAILDCITRYETRRYGIATAEPFCESSL